MKVAVIGVGTMGAGIAQVAAAKGAQVMLFDARQGAASEAMARLQQTFAMLRDKGKMSPAEAALAAERLKVCEALNDLAAADVVIEAVVERLEVKQELFREVERVVEPTCVLATNTSSLSVASIAASCQRPERVIGVHFFNPAPLMPLVEVVPCVQTSDEVAATTKKLVDSWGKKTVVCKDTPGFIVNRVARPFYGEALRIYEEGIASMSTIDWAMREVGGFKMGPFELMDYIGNDVNYAVTESIWTAFYFDGRYRPSFTQKRAVEAGFLGRKSGRGFYNYAEGSPKPEPDRNAAVGEAIFWRILLMLINEAADALHMGTATRDDIDTAMTAGVNYPKGLLRWADEKGIDAVLEGLDKLHHAYREERYRASVLLRQKVAFKTRFYPEG